MVVTLKADPFPYDMGNYLAEKSKNVLLQLEQMSKYIQTINDTSNGSEVKEELLNQLHPAIYDLTKIVTLAYEAEWSTSDTTMIVNGTNEDFEDILIRYGLAEETERWKNWQEFKSIAETTLPILEEIDQLLYVDRGESRVKIYDLLRRTRIENPIINYMRDMTEDVTNGNLDWETYVSSMKLHVRGILDELNQKLSNAPNFSPSRRVNI